MRILKSHPLLKLLNSYLIDSPQPANLSYLWNFGSLLAFCLIIQIVTGVTLAMHYNPSIEEAFNSIEYIMRDVNNGWLIRYLHSNTASAFFFLVYLHIGRGLCYGSNKYLITLGTIGAITLLVMIATGFLGYVLPYGQISLWDIILCSYVSITSVIVTWYFWVPKILGMNYNLFLGKVHFWVLFIGVNLTFFPKYFSYKCDAPGVWGLYFQDGASPQMEAIVELHNNIMFYLFIILFGVGWILLSLIINYVNNRVNSKYLNHNILVKLILAVLPIIILILIAFPSFKLLYLMDEVTDPNLIIVVEGHQWYWSYEYADFSNINDVSLNFNSYIVPESDRDFIHYILPRDIRIFLNTNFPGSPDGNGGIIPDKGPLYKGDGFIYDPNIYTFYIFNPEGTILGQYIPGNSYQPVAKNIANALEYANELYKTEYKVERCPTIKKLDETYTFKSEILEFVRDYIDKTNTKPVVKKFPFEPSTKIHHASSKILDELRNLRK